MSPSIEKKTHTHPHTKTTILCYTRLAWCNTDTDIKKGYMEHVLITCCCCTNIKLNAHRNRTIRFLLELLVEIHKSGSSSFQMPEVASFISQNDCVQTPLKYPHM